MTKLKTHQAFCSLPFSKLILNGWGDVSMCCYQLEQLGNILKPEVSVLDLWNSDKAKQIRAATNRDELHPICKSWNTCPYQIQEKKPYNFEVYENYDYPTYLEICLPNTHCNIGGENPSEDNPACIMCCRNYDMQPQPKITDILCEKAKPLIPYLRRLCVLGVAEPFWKNAIFDVLKKIEFQRYAVNIRVETNTNVTCFFPKTIDRWFDEVAFSDINFSMDAATASTYYKIRRLENGFEHLSEYVQYFCRKREFYGGSKRHKAIIYNNINVINVHEMERMVEMAVDCEVDQLIMIPTHDQCGRVFMGEMLLNSKNVKMFAKNADAARKRADDLGLNLIYPKPFNVVAPPVGQEFIQISI